MAVALDTPRRDKSIRTTPSTASLPDAVAAVRTREPKPKVPPRVQKRIKKLWDEIEDAPHFTEAMKRWVESQKTLLPGRYDITDPFRGAVPKELRRRKDDRRVNVPLSYRSTMQTVATTVPEDHSFRWRAREMVPAMGMAGGQIGRDPELITFGKTIELTTQRHLEEINWQDTAEAFVQDATSFPMAILKVTFQREFHSDAITDNRSPDTQDQHARLDALRVRFMRGDFTQEDADYQEMIDLQQELSESTEIDVSQNLVVDNLPMDGFRFSRNVRSLEAIYSSPFMSHDLFMVRSEVEEKFPYQALEDGTWTGIHPDDLAQAVVVNPAAVNVNDPRVNPRAKKSTAWQQNSGTRGKVDDDDLLLVREVWLKRDGKVLVLVNGIDYAALEYVPKRQPQQWYPFVILVMNRIFGQAYGISDVELVADLQHRMNRKWTDDEKLREHAKPRGVYNLQNMDEKEVIKLSDIPVGQLKGINCGGSSLKDEVMWMQVPYNAEWTNTVQDEQNFARMATQPPSFSGDVGKSKFASENDSAMDGLRVSSSFRQRRVRRVLERFYTIVAEILLQELRPQDVKALVGPNALWPAFWDAIDSKARVAAIMEKAKAQAGAHLGGQVAAAMQSGDPQAMQDAQASHEALTQEMHGQMMQTAYGQAPDADPSMTRQSMFQKLKCKVTVSMNGVMDKQQRMQQINGLFDALGKAGQASQMAGMHVDFRPFLRMTGKLLECDDELDDMFQPDPNALTGSLVQSMQQNPSALQPEAAMQIIQLGQKLAAMLAQAQAQAAMAQQQPAPGGAPGQPAPARGGPPRGVPRPSAASQPQPQPAAAEGA